jgi:hypothetical protein
MELMGWLGEKKMQRDEQQKFLYAEQINARRKWR